MTEELEDTRDRNIVLETEWSCCREENGLMETELTGRFLMSHINISSDSHLKVVVSATVFLRNSVTVLVRNISFDFSQIRGKIFLVWLLQYTHTLVFLFSSYIFYKLQTWIKKFIPEIQFLSPPKV